LLGEILAHAAWRLGNLLDIRPKREFVAGHLVGSVSLPVAAAPDAATVDACLPSIFLPPRHEPLVLIAGSRTLGEAVGEHLVRRGRQQPLVAAFAPADWRELPSDAVATGESRRHLWRPSPFLEQHLELLPPPAAGPVLDLACGSGRAAVWLAERGFHVTGVDRQAEALGYGERLAASRGVHCEFINRDLRDLDRVPRGPWAVVLVFRYLHRPLLARLTALLKPGGVALIRTFRHQPGFGGPPSRRHRLEAGELPQYFPPDLFEVLIHEENLDPDGRPAAGIVARRHRPTKRAI